MNAESGNAPVWMLAALSTISHSDYGMKRLFQAILLVMFGLSIGLGISEVAVRVFAPYSRDHVVPPGMFAIDSTLGWKLQPGYSGRHRTRYFDVEYAINSLGLRDRARRVPKPDSIRRLLLFGDSQTFGWGVTLAQRFSDIIERENPGFELWNFSVPGYGLDQQVLAYMQHGSTIPSNGAVLHVSRAVLDRMHSGVSYRKPKPHFVVDSSGRMRLIPSETGSTAIADVMYRLLSPFYLPYFVERQLAHLGGQYEKAVARSRSVAAIDTSTMILAKAVLLRARDTARERSHELFIIVALPPESARDLSRFAHASGITFISTGWSSPPTGLVFGKTDRHWVPRLHRDLAGRFAPVLIRQAAATM